MKKELSPIGCNCGGNKVKAATLRWTVDLAPVPGAKFADGSTKKVYMTVGEANAEVAKLNLQGKIRPRPATSND